MEEVWKDIKYFPNYQVSNLGNVRNKSRGNILKPNPVLKKCGYVAWEVNITDERDGKQKHGKISRLVATAFLPNPDNLPVVDHIDRNPENNRLDNLRWYSQSDNNRNTNVRKDNKSGHKGVYWMEAKQKYKAEVCLNKKNIHIGVYKTKEEAIKAREEYIKNLDSNATEN